MSDTHGLLPVLDDCDLACICGDVFPQEIERDIVESEKWFNDAFVPWIRDLPCKFVIMIPGNHCFFLEAEYRKHGAIVMPASVNGKCVCLVDETFVYRGLHFYGTPWVTNLPRWAFNTDDPAGVFEKIPYDCDVLLTHHAPKYEKLGCSYPDTPKERDFGCIELTDAILSRPSMRVHLFGHIHTGTHDGVKLGNAMSYNVSILDEQYQRGYPVTYMEIAIRPILSFFLAFFRTVSYLCDIKMISKRKLLWKSTRKRPTKASY